MYPFGFGRSLGSQASDGVPPEPEQKAVKCELCNGEPQCVLFCPTNALATGWHHV